MTATDRLYAEMGALATAFAWSRDSLMALEHAERRRWVAEAETRTRDVGTRRQGPGPARPGSP